jgi:hypothetical protein
MAGTRPALTIVRFDGRANHKPERLSFACSRQFPSVMAGLVPAIYVFVPPFPPTRVRSPILNALIQSIDFFIRSIDYPTIKPGSSLGEKVHGVILDRPEAATGERAGCRRSP